MHIKSVGKGGAKGARWPQGPNTNWHNRREGKSKINGGGVAPREEQSLGYEKPVMM
jgi:hypothetical protein